ncbi:hypothetical protein TUM20985_53410 [Mycobacterium antarcticum]|uniref:hypothetical protein n=1 Tax=unclassified Mycolicibacterium TaxID=2636767 RepID=UPI0023A23B69|nr:MULTISPECIES: hypothetical protein [unclassified Mycolicibacterium]BDX34794.1 hypothetical protein TUM20985_53410 [Mycolicibacterium sp. TUM20985]GLP77995.1 hypothetical protein TUM20983_51050 [Mycolicibacterium sp. TUM20983]GLP81602.1 hypothetical protein TUM20984_30220 [Mycolicibacterium sp. TUM20984]
MRRRRYLTPSLGLTMCAVASFGVAALVGAPAALAGCNDSSGTVVCAQGDIRGTDAPPPARPDLGSYGTWCNGNVCFPGDLFGVVVGRP